MAKQHKERGRGLTRREFRLSLRLSKPLTVGVDTRAPVDDSDYQLPFRFTGKIAKLTFTLGPVRLAEIERQIMHAHLVAAKD